MKLAIHATSQFRESEYHSTVQRLVFAQSTFPTDHPAVVGERRNENRKMVGGKQTTYKNTRTQTNGTNNGGNGINAIGKHI